MPFTFAGRYQEIFIGTSGRPLTNRAVTVYNPGTTTPTSLYTDRTKAATAANPFTTDGIGNGTFFADPGDYDLSYAGNTIRVSVGIDPVEANVPFDARDYGAKGDGVADDGPAIRLAITAGAGATVRVPAGTYKIATGDGASPASHALLLNAFATKLVGDGKDKTFIDITANSLTWGVALDAAFCELRGMTIRFNGTTAPFWLVGMPGAPSTSHQSCLFDEVRATYLSGTIPTPPTAVNDAVHSNMGAAIYAFGPEFPGTTSFDCANVTVRRCDAIRSGGTGVVSGFMWGNGFTGNVAENFQYDCGAIGCKYGVHLGGADIKWFAGGMGGNTRADIFMQQPTTSPSSFHGLRAENGFYAIENLYTGEPRINLHGCSFVGSYQAAIIQWLTGRLLLEGCDFFTNGAGTTFNVNPSGGNTATLIAIGVTTDVDNPYPAPVGGNAGKRIIVIGATNDNTALPTTKPTRIDNGLAVAEVTNGKQNIAVLVAGAVTVANTSVTANSRIFLTSQVDGGTPGFLRVSARTAGTSFTVTSSSGTDTSTFAYEIFEPA